MAGSSSSRPNLVTTVSPRPSPCHLWLLSLIPLALAVFSFLLQWQDAFTNDPLSQDNLHEIFSGMDGASSAGSSPAKSKENSGCQDFLSRSYSPSFPYLKNWTFESKSDLGPKICVTTTTSAGLEQTLPWIFYHKVIGVSNFFMFVEGKAASPNVYKVLKTIPGVKVTRRTRELEEQQAKSRYFNGGFLRSYLNKPCNSQLFVRQSLNMEMAIVMAREAGMDWIVHIDTDELVHPAGTSNYSFKQLLSDVPDDVDNVVLHNYESCVERDDIGEPFSEVSMFKKNFFHLPYEVSLRYSQEVSHGNPGYFLTYENGKSAARIQDHLRPDGAHAWKNYNKTVKEMAFLEAALLHYTYSKFSDLTSRGNRCGCKPTLKNLQRCFFLNFDREAFIVASTATEEELRAWYRERVVWADKEQNLRLLRSGFFTRIYNPMIIIQSLSESGLFSSVIASAHRNILENRNFSIPTRN